MTENEHKTVDSQPSNEHSGSAFRKSAFVAVLIAFVVYLYQAGLFSIQSAKLEEDEPYVKTVLNRVKIKADVQKQGAILEAFKHAWSAYERDAMGCDEYHPISKKGTNLTDSGGIGYTVIDAIDTMQLMGLESEYNRARDWIANKLSFDRDGNFNTFETTIRVLGGLLSAYHLSSDPLFLSKATDLADRMLPAFDTPSGLPLGMVNLAKAKGVDDPTLRGLVTTAEVSTLQLEFKYLSYLADDSVYWNKAEKVMEIIKRAIKHSGLAPIYLSAQNGQFIISEVRLGSRGDSFYEYLLKQYLQTNKTEPMYLEMYSESMAAIRQSLIQKGSVQGLTFTAELLPWRKSDNNINWQLSPKQDHLVCFLAGSLMLGATTTGMRGSHVSRPPNSAELTKTARAEWALGEELLKTCLETHKTATGLSPEIIYFHTPNEGNDPQPKKDRDWYIKNNGDSSNPSYDARYILRPETIESLFLAYRLTGDEAYREQGWEIFRAIERHCRLPGGGYAGVLNVDDVNTGHMDRMETFFLSETLKYLYLLFSDDSVLPLEEYVFNTEAHPLPIFTPTIGADIFGFHSQFHRR